jgi:hypothetical protein
MLAVPDVAQRGTRVRRPAQRLYGRRGYIPDGRGTFRGQRPLSKGMQVTMDDDLLIWLTKGLVS